jgi:hypothetical protein
MSGGIAAPRERQVVNANSHGNPAYSCTFPAVSASFSVSWVIVLRLMRGFYLGVRAPAPLAAASRLPPPVPVLGLPAHRCEHAYEFARSVRRLGRSSDRAREGWLECLPAEDPNLP